MDSICLVTRFGFAVAAAVDICLSVVAVHFADSLLLIVVCPKLLFRLSLLLLLAVFACSVSSPVGRPNSLSVLHGMEASACVLRLSWHHLFMSDWW
jgi:hypothetical protein